MTILGPNALSDSTGATAPIGGATRAAYPTRPAPLAVSKSPAATATVSPAAELLSKLQQLKHYNPQAFQTTVHQMGETAKAEASKATGSDKLTLANVADQLGHVAKTGEVSVFQPPRHHRHMSHASDSAHATTGLGSLMQKLLEQVDVVLGPAASSPLSP